MMSAAPQTPARHDEEPDMLGASTPELAAQLGLITTRLSRRLRRQADVDLTPTMASALAAINAHGTLTLGGLADHENVAPPTITKVVNKLEEQGLVTRLVDPLDRRICRVECAPAGAALVEQSRERRNAWLASRLELLDPQDRERLWAAVDVLEALATGGRP